MCLFTHFAAGALAGGATGNVWAGMVAGVASHALLDAIPHYDHPDWRLEFAGGLLSLVALLLMPFVSLPAVLGGIFGMVPDLENLFHKLGKMRRDQFIFPSHTGLIPHGRALAPRSLVWQVAIFIACFGLLGLVSPSDSTAGGQPGQIVSGSADFPIMSHPVVEILSETDSRTVLRIDFPAEDFAGDWSVVDPMRVHYALPYIFEDHRLENPRRLSPVLTVTMAVPTRSPVLTRVIDKNWWREPEQPVGDPDLADFGPPAVFRSVPLSGTQIPLTVGGGILRSLVLEVIHPVAGSMAFTLSAIDPDGTESDAAPWTERIPAGVFNPGMFTRLSTGARREALARVATDGFQKAAVPELFGLSDHWAKLNVTTSGVFSISGQDMLQAGIPISSLHPGSLRLFRGGGLQLMADPSVTDAMQADRVGLNEVAIRVSGAGDGEWNLIDEIRFYGFGSSVWLDRLDPAALPLEHFDHPFAADAVYWLTWEPTLPSPLPGDPRRVVDVPRPASGTDRVGIARMRLHFEEQVFPEMGRVWDNWTWSNSVSSSLTKNFELPAVVAEFPGRFVMDFRGQPNEKYFSTSTIDAAAWANGDQATTVSTSFSANAQQDSIRVRLGGPFTPLAGWVNSLTLQNTSTWDGHRPLSLDSFDIQYWARLDLTVWPGQLEFAHWKDQVPDPGTLMDLEVTAPAGQVVQLWDVTVPDSPQSFLGEISSHDSGAYAFGLTRDPGTDRHLVALTENNLLKVDRLLLADPEPLRQTSVDLDYIVIHPQEFIQPARTLAEFRSTSLPDTDSPAAAAVHVQDIFDNFSGGQKDWRAIRNYLHYVYEAGGYRLRYVCLLGNACRDYRNYKNRTPLVDNYVDFVPTEVRTNFPGNPEIFHLDSPYATDDGLVSFESVPDGDLGVPTLACGRLPAVNLSEAENMVEQAINYAAETETGSWRNSVMMVADDLRYRDVDPNRSEESHTTQSDYLVNNLIPASLDVKKIYSLAYDFLPGAINKPEVRADINHTLNQGTTLYNYTGHGSSGSLADERIFESVDIGNLTNGMKRAAFIAFSCDVGVFDSTVRRSMAEEFLIGPNGGAIAAICASQASYIGSNEKLGEAFYRNLFPDRHVKSDAGLGRVLQLGKAEMGFLGDRKNSQRYNLMGDPAGILPHPVDDLVFSADSLDKLQAGLLHSVILDSSDSGTLLATGDPYDLLVEESAHSEYFVDYWGLEYSFLMSGGPIFQGSGSVGDQALAVPFMVPVQIRYGQDGRVRLIVSTSDGDHVAEVKVPAVRSEVEVIDDIEGPVIQLAFANGLRKVRPGATLTANLSDSSGIAMLGTSPANSILLEFDDTGFMADITESFLYDPDSYTSGRIDLVLPADLSRGEHQVALHASDSMGNVGSDTLSFEIGDPLLGGMVSVALFPNPTRGPCRLVLELGEPMELQWDIYTLAGKRLRSITGNFDTVGPVSLKWDGRDQQADEIANGTYLYVLRGRTDAAGERQITRTGKLVIMR
ncbi:MAG: hypothetical protein KOO60_04295 [Gemmatimonadales bacterium]|nr:hypothetical protein [Gemmatimonadales bacterium]